MIKLKEPFVTSHGLHKNGPPTIHDYIVANCIHNYYSTTILATINYKSATHLNGIVNFMIVSIKIYMSKLMACVIYILAVHTYTFLHNSN